MNNKAKIKTGIGFFHFQKPHKEEMNHFKVYPAARKSLLVEIGEPSQEQMNNKTQEVSQAFCDCHNYKEEIDKLLK